MKISINCGHTVKFAGYGSVYGSFKESQITRAIGNEVIRLLREGGHTVHNSTVNYAISQKHYLKRVVEMANAKEIDLFISLHCNASSTRMGHGTEVYTYKGKRLPVAVSICNKLSSLGFKNRGVKDGSNLYVVKNTKAPAILVEVCFIDNPLDIDLYKKWGYKNIAKTIVEGIV